MQQTPFLAALTGSIGSGKSTVASLFEAAGALVIDADALAHEAVQKGSEVLSRLAARFGREILLPRGDLDRKALARLIFGDSSKRRDAESIIHPAVRALFEERFREAPHDAIVIYNVALLFESAQALSRFEKIIVVTAPDDILIERIVRRDNCTREEAQRRLTAQLPSHEKERRADFVIRNEGTEAELRARVHEVYLELLAAAKKHRKGP